MDTTEDLRKKLQELEKKSLDLSNQHNHDMSHYEKDITKLRLELERGEALHRLLESEMSLARKEAEVQMYSTEEELCNTKAKLLELQARESGQTLSETNITIEALRQGSDAGSGNSLPSESFSLSFVPKATSTPRGAAPADLPSYFLPQATSTPVDRSPNESIPSYFMPRGASTPVGPAPNVYCGWPADRTYDVSRSSVPLVIVVPPSSDMNALYVNPPPVVPAPVPAPNPACWGGPAYSSGSSFGSDYGTDPFATRTISDSSNWSAQATGGPSTFSSCSGYSTWPFSSYWSSGASDSSSFGSRRAYSLPSLRPFLDPNLSARYRRNLSWL